MSDGGGDRVRAQYEALPYPARDPADEARRLITGSPSHLLEIEHYVLNGRRAGPLSALVAGCGTGDGAIMLAQQLADRGAGSVTALDLSEASLAVARARAEARGLANIRFLQGSLLELATIAPGPYDYIDCCGVLHHLADPPAGLAALRAALAPGGGLGLMLYAPLGRAGVYETQSALRRLGAASLPAGEAVALAERLLADLPEGNRLRRNPFLGDHLEGGAAGIADLLLHPRDRAYRIGDIVSLLADAGLRIAAPIEPARYDPLTWIGPDWAAEIAGLPAEERWALAEELAGSMKTHTFYAVAADHPEPAWSEADVPVLRGQTPARLAAAIAKSPHLSVDFDGRTRRFSLPSGSARLLARIDGTRPLGDLLDGLGGDRAAARAKFDAIRAVLAPLNLLLFAGRTD